MTVRVRGAQKTEQSYSYAIPEFRTDELTIDFLTDCMKKSIKAAELQEY